MPVSTTFKFPDPGDEEPDDSTFSSVPWLTFSNAADTETGGCELTSMDAPLVGFTDRDSRFRNFDQDEPS